MDWEKILSLMAMMSIFIAFIAIVVSSILEIKGSREYYKKMNAELELMRTTLKREHDLRQAVVEFGDELVENYYVKAKEEFYNHENDYNHGKLDAVEDIMEFFFKFLEKHIGNWDDKNGEESSD